MKVKSLKIRGLFTFCVMLTLGSMSNLSMAGQFCSRSALAGSWSYYEDGTHNLYGPWSEIGSFTLNSSGRGSGVAFITAAQARLVNVEVPLSSVRINSFNDANCIGTASFDTGSEIRTISFTVISNSAFDYISTQGDLTIVGHAKKRVTQNNQ